ncbi:MAG: DUF1259 domain-containing protein [Candidatus Hydrogenedentes bacterium]|nr:DUF1259 domain-containing protein [Candidatus Hydrogenedentota bacterium]
MLQNRCLGAVYAAIILAIAAGAELDTAKIEEAAGAKGTLNHEEGVFKVTYPRKDVTVRVDGTVLPPFMGLTSWAAFKEGEKAQAMVMGDMVLFQDEVNPAMSAALENGLAVTALHNHFFYDEPKVYFMHIGGEGEAVALAAAVRKVQETVGEVRAASPKVADSFGQKALTAESAISPGPLEELLGKGQVNDGMYKVVIGRTTKMPCGCEAGKEMGVNTWAAFYGTDSDALVDGDFAVFEGELQPVLSSLRKSGINIVAIHNHMESENPRVLFLHYWGRGVAAELAKGLRAALDIIEKR